ncbi:unnamed protein product [Moneuplotes crassus]|uniref:Uncharacterized protein n=1 Tax=Euplotes crassus TaxID=5936 RepID=A0AAD1XNA7_EUPCR|nr:unnamed protein product [Moneuplotes crassus]
MKKSLQLIVILAFLACAQAVINSKLGSFRSPPDLRLSVNMFKIEKHMKFLVPFVRSAGLLFIALGNYNLPFRELFRFSDELVTVILSVFHCKNLSCLSPAYVLTKGFNEFRHFSRSSISEFDYGFKELAWKYGKKLFGIIKKIIDTEGMATFDEKSSCIRMRICQYFMPTFVGNDTSNCSEFDGIIRSFSEQPIDPGIDWISLCIKLIVLTVLIGANYFVYNLTMKEYKKYQISQKKNPQEVSLSVISRTSSEVSRASSEVSRASSEVSRASSEISRTSLGGPTISSNTNSSHGFMSSVARDNADELIC